MWPDLIVKILAVFPSIDPLECLEMDARDLTMLGLLAARVQAYRQLLETDACRVANHAEKDTYTSYTRQLKDTATGVSVAEQQRRNRENLKAKLKGKKV